MSQRTLDANLNIIQNSNLEISLLNGDLNIIQKLDDEPNDVGGLTAGELKAKFDEAGNTIKTYINGTLIPQILSADATEAQRTANENARAAAESARVTAESARAAAETSRAAAESARATAENARVTAETARAAAEGVRNTQYQTAEAARNTQYTGAEAARESAFSQAEAARQAAETSRAAAETARGTAESARAAAEDSRATAEAARAAAETARSVWEPYDEAHAYQAGNKVSFAGSSYLCTQGCTGTAPTDDAFWQLIASRGLDGDGALVPVAIPQGRLLGDVDGDGRITYADANIASRSSSSPEEMDDIATLCADMDKSGVVDSLDVLMMKQIASGYEPAPTEDIYGNWTYDETAGLFCVSIPSPAFSMDRSAVVFIPGLWPRDVFARAELTEGALVIYTETLPTEGAAALVLVNEGSGEAVLCAQRVVDTPPVEEMTLAAKRWSAGGGGAYYYQRVSSDYVLSCEHQLLTANPYPLQSRFAYFEAGIYIVDGSNGTVQFRAKTRPTEDITLKLVVQDL